MENRDRENKQEVLKGEVASVEMPKEFLKVWTDQWGASRWSVVKAVIQMDDDMKAEVKKYIQASIKDL